MLKRSFRQSVWVVSSGAVAKVFSDPTYGQTGYTLKITHPRVPPRPILTVREFRSIFRLLFLFAVFSIVYFYSVLGNTAQLKPGRRMLKRSLVKVADVRVYIYSAIGVKYESTTLGDDRASSGNTDHATYNHVNVVGWEHATLMHSDVTCCQWLQNGTIARVKPRSDSDTQARYGNNGNYTTLKAVRYACPLNFPHTDVKSISLSFEGRTCSNEAVTYIDPTWPPPRNRTGLALCTKIAYGQINPELLREWFNVQRVLGVSKVLVFVHMASLNDESMDIFRHYEAVEFAELVPHDIPETDVLSREVGGTSMQCYNDDRVSLLDCQERLYGYKYVAILDKDEILLPRSTIYEGALAEYVDQKWNNRQDLAGIRFFTQIHPLPETDQAPSSRDVLAALPDVLRFRNSSREQRQTSLSQYPLCSGPMKDRAKFIYMPTRVRQGAIHTHSYERLPGFIKETVKPSEAVVHHYRRARQAWGKAKAQKLLPENLGRCEDIQTLLRNIEIDVTDVGRTPGVINAVP